LDPFGSITASTKPESQWDVARVDVLMEWAGGGGLLAALARQGSVRAMVAEKPDTVLPKHQNARLSAITPEIAIFPNTLVTSR
jgi:hypothetical protein